MLPLVITSEITTPQGPPPVANCAIKLSRLHFLTYKGSIANVGQRWTVANGLPPRKIVVTMSCNCSPNLQNNVGGIGSTSVFIKARFGPKSFWLRNMFCHHRPSKVLCRLCRLLDHFSQWCKSTSPSKPGCSKAKWTLDEPCIRPRSTHLPNVQPRSTA